MEEILKKINLDIQIKSLFSMGIVYIITLFLKKQIMRYNLADQYELGRILIISGMLSVVFMNLLLNKPNFKKLPGIIINLVIVIYIITLKNDIAQKYIEYFTLFLVGGYIVYMMLAWQDKVGNGIFLKEIWDYSVEKGMGNIVFLSIFFSEKVTYKLIYNSQFNSIFDDYISIKITSYINIFIAIVVNIFIYGVLKYMEEDEFYKKVGNAMLGYCLKMLLLLGLAYFVGVMILNEGVGLAVLITMLLFVIKEIKMKEMFLLIAPEKEIDSTTIIKDIAIIVILGVIFYIGLNYLGDNLKLGKFRFDKEKLGFNIPLLIFYLIMIYLAFFRANMMFIKNRFSREEKRDISKRVRFFIVIIFFMNILECFQMYIAREYFKLESVFQKIGFNMVLLTISYLLIELYIVNYLVEKNKKIKTFF